MSDTIRLCALIPYYNHPDAIEQVCQGLAQYHLPIIIVDDGSDAQSAAKVTSLSQREGYHLVRMEVNRGKGAAVREGLKAAERLGYSHALQIDADGQHNVADIQAFIEEANRHPEVLAAGYPRYDDSVPKARFYGRYATHIWVWINTLSLAIRDSMCGVRIYPVAPLNHLLAHHACGDRMSFDTEVLVRWQWQQGVIVNLPVDIRYPQDGVSHFKMLEDNVRISWMHTRLFCGMLIRLPLLLKQKIWR